MRFSIDESPALNLRVIDSYRSSVSYLITVKERDFFPYPKKWQRLIETYVYVVITLVFVVKCMKNHSRPAFIAIADERTISRTFIIFPSENSLKIEDSKGFGHINACICLCVTISVWWQHCLIFRSSYAAYVYEFTYKYLSFHLFQTQVNNGWPAKVVSL